MIDDLNSRVRALEEIVTKRAPGAKEGDFKLHVASREAMEAVRDRMEDVSGDLDRVKVDMGELMHVYDDMQVRIMQFSSVGKSVN